MFDRGTFYDFPATSVAVSFPPTPIECNDTERAFRRSRVAIADIFREEERAGEAKLFTPRALGPLHFNRALRRAREICIRERSHRGLWESWLVQGDPPCHLVRARKPVVAGRPAAR